MRYMLRPPTISIPGLDEGVMDELFKSAVEVTVQYDRCSASLLQRRLGIGYARAARLIDQLETAGVLGPAEGSTPREVLIRSVDEILGEGGNKSKTEDENVLDVSQNYKVPTNIKLSRVESPAWGKQLSEVVDSSDFKDLEPEYPILLGYDDESKLNKTCLAEVENLIITGNPQSKKENWLDTILVSLLLKYPPQELRLILIHPNHYFDLYNGIPHLLSPSITDFRMSVSALKWLQAEIGRRKKMFAQAGVRGFEEYTKLPNVDLLPRILTVIFCEWVDVETTDSMKWITSTGLETGTYLFIITNRMNDKTVSSDIKANIPNRVVFTVTSAQDAKLAGVKEAENLKEGEMLYRKGNPDPKKLTTIFTPELNVKEIVEAVKHAASSL
jgi:DNA segregation ATPase FtsK/SpoIIIE-like protein